MKLLQDINCLSYSLLISYSLTLIYIHDPNAIEPILFIIVNVGYDNTNSTFLITLCYVSLGNTNSVSPN
jgi:hypothetical protein